MAQQLEGAWQPLILLPTLFKKKKKKKSRVRSSFLKVENGERAREEEERKPIYNPVVTPNFRHSHRWLHGPLGLPRRVGLSEKQQRGLCPARVTEPQFEVAAMGLSSSMSMLELVGCRLL